MAKLFISTDICRSDSHFGAAASIPIVSLILHEAVEKALIDQLGLRYLHAHQIATPRRTSCNTRFGSNLAGV
jgi:hypothetical protein